MNYCGFSTCDTANGPGIRVSLFVSGCTIHCKGCFNPESWDFKAGKPFDVDAYQKLFKALEEPYVRGLSILGGDPFEEENLDNVMGIVQEFRNRFGNTKDLWIWSGRTKEQLEKDPRKKFILEHCDVLVDGPFVEKFKIHEPGQFKGSSNQRVIYFKNEGYDGW